MSAADNVSPAEGEPIDDAGRPFSDLRDTGLLWLINRVVFHPRGYALGLSFAPDPNHPLPSGGVVTGWILYGDGTAPWSMGDPPAELIESGFRTEDDLFRLIKALMP